MADETEFRDCVFVESDEVKVKRLTADLERLSVSHKETCDYYDEQISRLTADNDGLNKRLGYLSEAVKTAYSLLADALKEE